MAENPTKLIKQHIIEKYEFVKNDIRLDEYKDKKYDFKQEHWIWWFFPTLKEGKSDTLDKTSIKLEDIFIDELLKVEKEKKHMYLWTKILNRICNKLVKHKYTKLSEFFTNDIDVARIRSFIYIFLHVYQLKLIAVPDFRDAIIRLKRFDKSFDKGISDIMKDYPNIWVPPKKKLIEEDSGITVNLDSDKLKKEFYIYTYEKIVESVRKIYPDNLDKQYYWILELIEQYNFIYDYDNITSADCRKKLLESMKNDKSIKLSNETVINDSTKIIYALSDIHADIQAFIISLRDCAKVIDKDDYNPNVEDPYLNYMLEKDLNIEEEQYDMSLGYRWIKPDTYVVICGDILDGARPRSSILGIPILKKDRQEHDYLQLEIKLLMFINELNRQAIEKGSRIFKIIGNHDMENIKGSDIFIKTYNSEWVTTTTKPNYYYKKNERNIVFTYKKIGFYILMKHNLYFGLVINNNLFVHGNMSIYRGFVDNSSTPQDIIVMYETINVHINNRNSSLEQWAKIIYKEVFFDLLMAAITDDREWQHNYSKNENNIKQIIDAIHNGTFNLIELEKLLKQKNNNTIEKIENYINHSINEHFKDKKNPNQEIYQYIYFYLNQRYTCHGIHNDKDKGECLIKEIYRSFYTWDTLWSREHTQDNINNRNEDKEWCKTIKQQLAKLHIDRLIVGHCPQSNYNNSDKYKNLQTLSELKVEDAVSMKFSDKITKGSGNGSNIGKITGITGECIKGDNDFLVYHVDIASSRAFDSSSLPTKNVTGNKRNLEIMGRTPQVLEIINNKVSVIKSKETNTRLHQPRQNWEKNLGKLELEKIKLQFVKFTTEGSDTDFSNIKYYDKYITNGKKVVLTNLANANITYSDSGTTDALEKIFNKGSNKFYLKENMTNIYTPDDKLFDGKTHINGKKDLDIKGKKYPLGSIFYENNTNISIDTLSEYIKGCYHIRGYDFKNLPNKEKVEKEFSPIVKEYYGAILNDFAENKRADILHLVQSPRDIITTNAMLSAIKKFKTKYEQDISKFYPFTIIIDSTEDLYKNIELESEVFLPEPKVVLSDSDIPKNKLFIKHIYQMLLHHMLKYEQYCSKYGIESSTHLSYDNILGKMNSSSLAGGNYNVTYLKNKHNYEQFDRMLYYEIYKNNKFMYQKLY